MKRPPRPVPGPAPHPPPPRGPSGGSGRPRLKRIVFTCIAAAFPFLLLALVEAGLRIFSYGGDLGLIVERTVRGHAVYEVNRNVGRRFFTNAGVIPEAADEMFPAARGLHTRRVFCVGESTMQGFPYEFNATAVSFLRDRLRTLLPEDTVEVINVGLSAVGSYVVRDFVDELLRYEPDLIVVYVGHNEFYGAYGPGSAVAVRGGPWLVRLHLRLLHFKTYLLLRDLYLKIAPRGANAAAALHDATLMQAVVGNSTIPLGSDTYRAALRTYGENLAALIGNAGRSGVPVLVSALVCNIGDQAPFVSVDAPGITAERRQRWTRAMDAGERALAGGAPAAAADSFTEAAALDSTNAWSMFRLGEALALADRFEKAREVLLRAKDLDALRFRATEEFQDTLLAVCARLGAPVARADSAFAANSPHGIPGRTLLLEHVHPNIQGYFLLGKVWAEAIQARRLLSPTGGRWGAPLSDSAYLALSAVSAFDEAEGRIKVSQLTKRWPFRQVPDPSPFVPGDSVTALVYASLQRKTPWSEIRYHLADYYGRQGMHALARRECRAVARVIPFSFQPLLRIADSYAEEGRADSAAAAYRRCIAVEENPYAHMKLGFLFLQGNRLQEAVREFEEGFRVDGAQGGKLGASGEAMGRYLLGVALANSGRTGEARESLERALAIEPSLEEARNVLRQLP